MFVPRTVKRKRDQLTTKLDQPVKPKNSTETETTYAVQEESNDDDQQKHIVATGSAVPFETADYASQGANEDDEEPIKLFSSEQRLVVPGQEEPECIVCGKYGEYINDETDNDVCSLECKRIDTDLRAKRSKTAHPPPEAKIVHCYVADNVHAKLTNYQEAPDVANMPAQQKKAMMDAFNIKVKGTHIPNPITSFEQCRDTLGQQLVQNIDQHGWFMATGVQRLAVPCMLAGRDVYAIAPVGSGKTGAFAIPILAHCQSLSAMHQHKRRSGPYALILSPTRDLCVQIEATIKNLARGLRNTRTALLVGNQPISDQIYRLRKGVQIVIGTPGRILDLATYHPHMLRLWRMRLVVLDEASVLLGAGLNKQVRQILGRLSQKIVRQTCLFTTATSQETENISRKLLQPVEISVDQLDLEKEEKAVKKIQKHLDVKQTVLWVENASKAKKLLTILDDPKYFVAPVLVFVQSRLAAEFLTRSLKKRRLSGHWRVVAMHSDKTLEERSEIIEGMNAEEPAWDVVISTDVLASGINLSHVRLVINYDMASTLDSYARRIACAAVPETVRKEGKRGHAITFVNNEDKHLLEKLAKLLANKPPTDVTPLPPELRRLL